MEIRVYGSLELTWWRILYLGLMQTVLLEQYLFASVRVSRTSPCTVIAQHSHMSGLACAVTDCTQTRPVTRFEHLGMHGST